MLLVLAALVVTGAALSGSWSLTTVAAVLGVVLGVAATRITNSELAVSRRDAARDRAVQAQAYRELTVLRTDEQAAYVESVTTRSSAQERTISGLERELRDAQGFLIDAHRQLLEEQLRADDSEREVTALGRRLDEAEGRAAQAIVRIAEIEQELDVVTAEWQASQLLRKHA